MPCWSIKKMWGIVIVGFFGVTTLFFAVLGTALLATLRALSPAALFAPTRADCDLIDQHATWRAIADFQPTVVFHLAGRVAGLGGNLAFTGQAYFENAQINLNVVEAVHKSCVLTL